MSLSLFGLFHSPLFSDSIVGNSCLCISHLAGHGEYSARLAAFVRTHRCVIEEGKDLMDYLVAVMHQRRGDAQKNAAIAIAKLSKDGFCMQRIRDLHAIEIIMTYMKKNTV